MSRLISLLSLLTLLFTVTATAGTTDAYFDDATGKIVLPHLIVGDTTYYVTLTLADPEGLVFTADLECITDFSPPAEIGDTVNIDVSDIVSSWGFPGTTSTVTFNNDRTYEQSQEAGIDDNCAAGGIETGTYAWEPSTGILLAIPITDANESCGLSDPRDGIPVRIFIEGNSMQILEKGDGVPLEELAGFRV